MAEEAPLINRVAQSGIITLNLEDYYPEQKITSFDLKDYLFMELILKEKDFRTALKTLDWTPYENTIVCVYCSVDVIIPVWAYMLVATYLKPLAFTMFQGSPDDYLKHHYRTIIEDIHPEEYDEKRVVIKGCSDKPVPASAYMDLTRRIIPHAQSVMYGEPCSTVPVFKRPRKV